MHTFKVGDLVCGSDWDGISGVIKVTSTDTKHVYGDLVQVFSGDVDVGKYYYWHVVMDNCKLWEGNMGKQDLLSKSERNNVEYARTDDCPPEVLLAIIDRLAPKPVEPVPFHVAYSDMCTREGAEYETDLVSGEYKYKVCEGVLKYWDKIASIWDTDTRSVRLLNKLQWTKVK